MTTHGIDTTALDEAAAEQRQDGATPLFVAVDGTAAGLFLVADPLKPESAEAVAQLKALGLEVWMLTATTPPPRPPSPARSASTRPRRGAAVGEGRPRRRPAEPRPRGRDGRRRHQRLGRARQADLGIALGTGADVAVAASDITLVGGDLRGIVSAIALSRRTVTTIKQGLGWAFVYNLALIPVAAGALYWWNGVLLDPVLASAAMAMSSVSVVTNAPAPQLPPSRHGRGDSAASAADPGHPVGVPRRASPSPPSPSASRSPSRAAPTPPATA